MDLYYEVYGLFQGAGYKTEVVVAKDGGGGLFGMFGGKKARDQAELRGSSRRTAHPGAPEHRPGEALRGQVLARSHGHRLQRQPAAVEGGLRSRVKRKRKRETGRREGERKGNRATVFRADCSTGTAVIESGAFSPVVLFPSSALSPFPASRSAVVPPLEPLAIPRLASGNVLLPVWARSPEGDAVLPHPAVSTSGSRLPIKPSRPETSPNST